MSLPDPSEYHSFYMPYLKILENRDFTLVGHLKESQNSFNRLMGMVGEEKELYRYAEGKWTIREIVQHMIDAERVFVYRALRFSRSDNTELRGFDENAYVESCNANDRSMESLVEEFNTLRQATILMFDSVEEKVLEFKGRVEGNVMSVRAIGFICSGHVMHHLRVIEERYLS